MAFDRDFYRHYTCSDAWAHKRQRHLALHPACFICKANEDLDVHHKTYERLGDEAPQDLLTLCRMHHDWLHVRQREARWPLEDAHLILLDEIEARRCELSLE